MAPKRFQRIKGSATEGIQLIDDDEHSAKAEVHNLDIKVHNKKQVLWLSSYGQHISGVTPYMGTT